MEAAGPSGGNCLNQETQEKRRMSLIETSQRGPVARHALAGCFTEWIEL